MSEGFFKAIRNEKAIELIKLRPTAFALLYLIAYRARRDSGHLDGLEPGQAYIGDYENYGVTEQIYRTDKEYLKRYGFSTFKATSKGTIASLCDNSIFDINPTSVLTNTSTGNQRPTNDQLTTNKKEKKEEEYTPKIISDEKLQDIAKQFSISLSQARHYYEKVLDYEKSSGKRYKDYAAATRNFIRGDIERGKLNQEKVIRL